MLGAHSVKDVPPMMGAEDFSFYQEVVPGYLFWLGMEDEGKVGRLESLHSPNFRVNEDALPYGAALHASLAAQFLENRRNVIPLLEGQLHDEL